MPRVTIVPDDSSVVVDGTGLVVELPPVDANVHAIQFYPETGHATVEKKIGEREWFRGPAALALVQPFVEAHRAALARLSAKPPVERPTPAVGPALPAARSF